MIKYRTYFDKIETVEVVRETAASVYVGEKMGGRREAKRSSFYNYFDTWQEAHEFLVLRAEIAVSGAQSRLEAEERRFRQIRGMKEPLDTGARG